MRPGGFGYGIALGMVTTAGIGVWLAINRLTPDWIALACLFAFCAALVPVVEWFVELRRLHNSDRLAERERKMTLAERQARLQPVQPAAPDVVIRKVPYTQNGVTRDVEIEERRPARWVAWQRESEKFLDWYAFRRTLTAEALVDQEKALGSRSEWQALTDEWARVGLAVKTNGRRTELADPLPVTREKLASGKIDWTLDSAPPAVKAPPYPTVALAMNAQTAES